MNTQRYVIGLLMILLSPVIVPMALTLFCAYAAWGLVNSLLGD